MLPGYKRRSNIAAGVGFGTLMLAIICLPLGGSESELGIACLVILGLVSFVFWVVSAWLHAKGKGYSGLIGILLCVLGPLGWSILVSYLSDKASKKD